MEELKRVNEEKKKLSEKVLELEESAVNQSYDRTRMKSKSKGDKPSKTPVKYPKSESLKKRVGIKDQRRVL